MRVLALDPGAERMGWGCLSTEEDGESKPPAYHGSGYFAVTRDRNGKKPEPYQQYKLRLISLWVEEADRLTRSYKPDVVVSEIVPVVGDGGFVVATQSQLASTAITTVHAIAIDRGFKIEQVGATTVKAKIGGHKSASKPKVRDGVIEIMPQLANRKKLWSGAKAIWDEPDAIAVGLTYLGFVRG